MKTRDLTAELLSEIADDTNFLVCKFESITRSSGHIVYIYDNEDESEPEKYKILDYTGDEVYIWTSAQEGGLATTIASTTWPITGPRETIDLKNPDSIDVIEAWFLDIDNAHDSPTGPAFAGYSQIIGGAGGGTGCGGSVTITAGCGGSTGGAVTLTGGTSGVTCTTVTTGLVQTTATQINPWTVSTSTGISIKNGI